MTNKKVYLNINTFPLTSENLQQLTVKMSTQMANENQILRQSYGEITDMRTIRYHYGLDKTTHSEGYISGLFCPIVFGGIEKKKIISSFHRCSDHNHRIYSRLTDICFLCNQPISSFSNKKSRRRMGHIKLPYPIVNIRYINIASLLFFRYNPMKRLSFISNSIEYYKIIRNHFYLGTISQLYLQGHEKDKIALINEIYGIYLLDINISLFQSFYQFIFNGYGMEDKYFRSFLNYKIKYYLSNLLPLTQKGSCYLNLGTKYLTVGKIDQILQKITIQKIHRCITLKWIFFSKINMQIKESYIHMDLEILYSKRLYIQRLRLQRYHKYMHKREKILFDFFDIYMRKTSTEVFNNPNDQYLIHPSEISLIHQILRKIIKHVDNTFDIQKKYYQNIRYLSSLSSLNSKYKYTLDEIYTQEISDYEDLNNTKTKNLYRSLGYFILTTNRNQDFNMNPELDIKYQSKKVRKPDNDSEYKSNTKFNIESYDKLLNEGNKRQRSLDRKISPSYQLSALIFKRVSFCIYKMRKDLIYYPEYFYNQTILMDLKSEFVFTTSQINILHATSFFDHTIYKIMRKPIKLRDPKYILRSKIKSKQKEMQKDVSSTYNLNHLNHTVEYLSHHLYEKQSKIKNLYYTLHQYMNRHLELSRPSNLNHFYIIRGGILIVNRNQIKRYEKSVSLLGSMKLRQSKQSLVKNLYPTNNIRKKEKSFTNNLEIEVDILTRKNHQVYMNALYTKRFILFLLIITKQRPESFFMRILPVLPVDLRPLMRITAEGKQDVFITSDINYLYQSLIRSIIWSQKARNYKKIFIQPSYQNNIFGKEEAFKNFYHNPQTGYQKISLFDRHDIQVFLWILIDKRRVNKDILEERQFQSNSHKYESIIERLKGKEGQFRNNLLGKRLNYSGRSVITSGPRLQINTCGLPFEMIFELFKPYIINKVKSYYYLKTKKRQSSSKESQLKYFQFISFLKNNRNILSKDSPRSLPNRILKLQLKYTIIQNLFHLSPSFYVTLRSILNRNIPTQFQKPSTNTLYLKSYNPMNHNPNQKSFKYTSKSNTQFHLQKHRFDKDTHHLIHHDSLHTLNGQQSIRFEDQSIGHKRFQNNPNSYHLPYFKNTLIMGLFKKESITCPWHFAILDSEVGKKKLEKLKRRGVGHKDKKILDHKKKKKNKISCLWYINQSYMKITRIRNLIDKQSKSTRSGWYHFLTRYKPFISLTQVPFRDKIEYQNIYYNLTRNLNKSFFNQYPSKIEPMIIMRDFSKYSFLSSRSLIMNPTLFSLDPLSMTNDYQYIGNQFISQNHSPYLGIDCLDKSEIGVRKISSKKIQANHCLRSIPYVHPTYLKKEIDGTANENNEIIQNTKQTNYSYLTLWHSANKSFKKTLIHHTIKRKNKKKDHLPLTIRYVFSNLLAATQKQVEAQKQKEKSKEYLLYNIACLFSIPLRTQIISIIQKMIHTVESDNLLVQAYQNAFKKSGNEFGLDTQKQKIVLKNSYLTRQNPYDTKKEYNEYIKAYFKYKPQSKDKELRYVGNKKKLISDHFIPLLNRKELPSGHSWLLLESDHKSQKNKTKYSNFKSHINDLYRKNPFFIPQKKCNLVTHTISYMYKELHDLVREHPILLNRAPTLHRFNIQAFSPLLIHTKSIQLHPLVCGSFNADFDGDTMAVHIPLSLESQIESRILMSTSANIIATASSNGNLILTPSQDVVFGLYYATLEAYGHLGESNYYENLNEIKHALSLGIIDIHTQIYYRSFDPQFYQQDLNKNQSYSNIKKVISIKVTKERNFQYPKLVTQNISSPSVLRIKTTPGRVLLHNLLKGFSIHDKLRFAFWNDLQETNKVFTKKELLTFLSRVSNENTELSGVILSNLLDQLMAFGFYFSYKAGISIHKNDVNIPSLKYLYINKANQILNRISGRNTGKSNEENYKGFIQIWSKCVNSITNHILDDIKHTIPNKRPAIYMLIDSGARGSMVQMRQLSGMRGLMVKPSGEVLNMTIKSNFKEGLSVLEYFNSIHGARKGVIDTALKTATAGYLTRKLVNATKNIYIVKKDCYTNRGILLGELFSNSRYTKDFIYNSLLGRNILRSIKDPVTNEVVLDAKKSSSILQNLLHSKQIRLIQEKEIEFFIVRSVLTCDTDFQFGVCQKCYGFDLSSVDKKEASIGDPVGMLAAQSIGEPGTQLTMRTFHLGGTLSSSSDGSGNRIRSKKNGRVLILRRKILFGYSGKRVINRSSRIVLLSSKHSMIQTIDIPYASMLNVDDGDYVEEKDILFSHNYYYTFTFNLYKGLLTEQLIANDQQISFDIQDLAYNHYFQKSHHILEKCLYPYLEKEMAAEGKAFTNLLNNHYIDTPQDKKLDKITGIQIKETKKVKRFDHEYAYIAKSLLQTYYPSCTYYIQTTINIEDTKKGIYGRDNLLEYSSLEGDLIHIPSTPSYYILYPGRLLNQIPKDQSALSDITGGLTKIIRLFETVTTHQSLIANTNGFVLYEEKKSIKQKKKNFLHGFHGYDRPTNTYRIQEEKENSTITKSLNPVRSEDFSSYSQKNTLSKKNLVNLKRQREEVADRKKKIIQYAQLHLKDLRLLNSLSISLNLYRKRIYSSRLSLTDLEDHILASTKKFVHEELVNMSPLMRQNQPIKKSYVTIESRFQEFSHKNGKKMSLEDPKRNQKKSVTHKDVKKEDFQNNFLISNMLNRDEKAEQIRNKIGQGIKEISLSELQPFYEYTSQLMKLYPTSNIKWIKSRNKQNIKTIYKEFFPHSFLYVNPYVKTEKNRKYLSIYFSLLPFYNYLISIKKDKQKDLFLALGAGRNSQEIRFPKYEYTNLDDSVSQNTIRLLFHKLNPRIRASNDPKLSSIRPFDDFLSFTMFGFLTFLVVYRQKEEIQKETSNSIGIQKNAPIIQSTSFVRYLLDSYFHEEKDMNQKMNTSNDYKEEITSPLFIDLEKTCDTSYLTSTSSKDPIENLLKSLLIMAMRRTKIVDDHNKDKKEFKDVRHVSNGVEGHCNSYAFLESQKSYYLLICRLFYWFFSLYFEVLCQNDLIFQKQIINQFPASRISDLGFNLDLNENDIPKLQSFVEIQMEENRIQQKYNRKKEDYKVRSHDYLSKGDIITDENGLIPVSDAFLFLGFSRAIHQFIQQILQTYNESGVSIDIKHLEIVTLPLTSYVYIHTRNNDLCPRLIYNRLPIKSAYKSILRSAAHTSFYKIPKVFPSIKSLTSVCLHGDSVLGNASFQKPDFILGVIGIGTIDNPYYFQTHLFFSSLIPIGTGYIR